MSYPHDPRQHSDQPQSGPAWPSRDWNDYQPPQRPKRRVWPWVAGGAAVFLLACLALIMWGAVAINGQKQDPQPVPPPVAQTAPPVEEDTDDTDAADSGMRSLNESADDPSQPGDETEFLNHMMDTDRDGYTSRSNDSMLGMGRTVCEALDAGHTVVEILDMFPASVPGETQSSIMSGAVVFLCSEHSAEVQRQVDAYQAENGV